VGNKKEYIERLRLAVEHLHKCSAVHVETVSVNEFFNGEAVWQGEVEVFDISGHPKAKRAYGWSHASGKDDSDERFVAVLEIPPVDSALTAVRVSLVKQIRRGKK
jgi:hypothetical protein